MRHAARIDANQAAIVAALRAQGATVEAVELQGLSLAAKARFVGMHGSFDQLYSSYAAVTADLDDQARDKLFAANAERIYRLTAD